MLDTHAADRLPHLLALKAVSADLDPQLAPDQAARALAERARGRRAALRFALATVRRAQLDRNPSPALEQAADLLSRALEHQAVEAPTTASPPAVTPARRLRLVGGGAGLPG